MSGVGATSGPPADAGVPASSVTPPLAALLPALGADPSTAVATGSRFDALVVPTAAQAAVLAGVVDRSDRRPVLVAVQETVSTFADFTLEHVAVISGVGSGSCAPSVSTPLVMRELLWSPIGANPNHKRTSPLTNSTEGSNTAASEDAKSAVERFTHVTASVEARSCSCW